MSELLTIDVRSEIAKLAAGGLEGPWQVPAELVRRALACGARRVEVRLSRSRVVVSDDAPLPPGAAADLAALLDATAPEARRHDALLRLEASPAFALVTLASLARTAVRVEAAGGTRVELMGREIEASRAERWLRAVARFAPAPVGLDGEDLRVGFGTTLTEATAPPPLAGRLALLAGPEPARVFLLQHGIIAAHLVLPTLTGFAVATELGRTLPGPCSPAALRQAATPHLSGLLDAAFELALGSLQRARSETALGALRTLLLEAARLQCRRGEVLRAPMLTALVAGRERRLTLLELERVSRDGALWAIEPATDPSRVLLPDAPVLILGAGDRSRLGEALGLAFRTPPERPPAERRGLREWAENALDAMRRRVAALRPRRAVPAAEQRPEERTLIGALSRLPGLGRAVLVDGDGPVHRRGATWRLPRASRLVVAAGRVLARDPAWRGAAALALLPCSSTVVRSLIATGRAVPAPAEATARPSRP